jgi:hypothetical protein
LREVFDFVLSVVGELESSSVHAKAQIQRPNIRVRDTSKNEIIEHMTSDVPDLLSVHGALAPSPLTAPNATLSLFFRRGQPFPGDPPLVWNINCEHGEIRLVSPSGTGLQASGATDVSIKVHHYDTNEVEDVEWAWSERQKGLPIMARTVSECLYAFAEGREEGDGWVGIESAAGRARMIKGFLDAA